MKIQITPPPSLSYSRILPGTHFVLATSLGTINQYKINRLYCLLLICIKTSILFCVLRTEHTSSQHVCGAEHAFRDRQHTKRVRAATRQVCYVKILQHAKRVNLQHALLSPISTRQFRVRVLKTWCVLFVTRRSVLLQYTWIWNTLQCSTRFYSFSKIGVLLQHT